MNPYSYRSVRGAAAAVMLTALLGATPALAAESCAEQMAIVKEERQMPGGGMDEPGPNMEMADQHIAAAEAALQAGNESECLSELEEASTAIKMESRRHHTKNN